MPTDTLLAIEKCLARAHQALWGAAQLSTNSGRDALAYDLEECCEWLAGVQEGLLQTRGFRSRARS